MRAVRLAQDFQNGGAGCLDAMGESALKPVHGNSQASVSLGFYDIQYGLGLGEIDTAVEEGAQGKLAGTRGTGPATEKGLEDGLQGYGAARARISRQWSSQV